MGKVGGGGGWQSNEEKQESFFFLKHEQLNKDYSFCGTMEGEFKAA